MAGSQDFATLVASIKAMQRQDATAKEQWWAYCDKQGGGVRDPAKHGPEFLSFFLESYSMGARIEVQSCELGDIFNELQQSSCSFQTCWASYCEAYGDGTVDPLKQTEAFMLGFLDFVTLQGTRAMSSGNTGAPGAYVVGPPAKRPRTAVPTARSFSPPAAFRARPTAAATAGVASGAAWGVQGSTAVLDATKQALVDRIKAYQRADISQKEAWWAHCSSLMGGVRDPAKHDVASLQEFVDSYFVP